MSTRRRGGRTADQVSFPGPAPFGIGPAFFPPSNPLPSAAFDPLQGLQQIGASPQVAWDEMYMSAFQRHQALQSRLWSLQIAAGQQWQQTHAPKRWPKKHHKEKWAEEQWVEEEWVEEWDEEQWVETEAGEEDDDAPSDERSSSQNVEESVQGSSTQSGSRRSKRRPRQQRRFKEVLNKLDASPNGTCVRVSGPVSAQRLGDGFWNEFRTYFERFGTVKQVLPVMCEAQDGGEEYSGLVFVIYDQAPFANLATQEGAHDVGGVAMRVRMYFKR